MTTNKISNENIKFHIIDDGKLTENNEKVINKIRQGFTSVLGFIHYVGLAILGTFAVHLINQLRNENVYTVTPTQASWITSVFIVPMAPVCFSTGIALRKVAKRHLLMIASALEVIGWTIQYFYADSSLTAILVGRFIIGIAMAMEAPVIPLFIAEVTHPKIRGFCLSTVFMGLSVGLIIGNIIGGSFSWRTNILISIAMAIVNFAIICSLKETYVWHLKQNDVNLLRESFYWYRGHTEEAKLEVSKLISNHLDNTTEMTEKSSFTSDFKQNMKLIARPLIVTVTLMTTMHLSGYKVVAFYSINIIKGILPDLNIYILTTIVDVIRLGAAILGCILIKTIPIRWLVMISGSGSAVSHAFFCIFNYFSYVSEKVFPILGLVALIVFIIFASVGLSSLPWVVCGEIFPVKVKDIGSGISLFAYYIVFFLSIKYSQLLEVYFGLIGEFVFFGCCTAVGTLIMYFLMPETKNRTLGDIEEGLKEN